METKEILLDFLKQPLDNADCIFEIFATIPTAKIYKGNKAGERFLFIKGNRLDAATLVAHADTVFDVSGDHDIIEDGDVFRSGSSNYGIGADDRAGCAMLWLFKDLGHHILLCDYEESTHRDAIGNCVGSKYLMREHQDIAQIINNSSFVFEFDRRLAYGRRKEHYTCYNLPVSQEFRDFIEKNTGFVDDDNSGYTDIMELCTDVCGANICVGYSNAHTSNEKISISAFQNTYEIMHKLLTKDLKRFALEGKEENAHFPSTKSPEWLNKITSLYYNEPNAELKEQMKIRIKEQMRSTSVSDILKDSLYYSGCGNDVEPINFFKKHIHSFVYCLDTSYNLSYDSEFPSVKTQLKQNNFKKRVNIDLDIEFIKLKGWFQVEDENITNEFKANWSIWEHNNDFFSLLFIYCDSYTLWKNLYKNNQSYPKVFFFQGMFDAWKGGLGKNEGGKFIVNSEIYCDGYAVYRNTEFTK
jgi:hypothetical protein